ncbi:uncharacterized protein PHALS_00357 [Plasmopara halstedii]|uniref:Uncharacterized protein n=1 Tax=Plasmopara halstedii TaxID=4781 RepID=A0A0P1A642_PLAHL|nr:uncharacterized protein PHALS_00357 [Plasmopara halstedii]CEG36036.1 hypothetical protein PHALS_00357 [Plasmopara halstedii]|eukprot:XP_024572405.1 hypothetical protein PHALS_00357 [Plasmopara halstedii]
MKKRMSCRRKIMARIKMPFIIVLPNRSYQAIVETNTSRLSRWREASQKVF